MVFPNLQNTQKEPNNKKKEQQIIMILFLFIIQSEVPVSSFIKRIIVGQKRRTLEKENFKEENLLRK